MVEKTGYWKGVCMADKIKYKISREFFYSIINQKVGRLNEDFNRQFPKMREMIDNKVLAGKCDVSYDDFLANGVDKNQAMEFEEKIKPEFVEIKTLLDISESLGNCAAYFIDSNLKLSVEKSEADPDDYLLSYR